MWSGELNSHINNNDTTNETTKGRRATCWYHCIWMIKWCIHLKMKGYIVLTSLSAILHSTFDLIAPEIFMMPPLNSPRQDGLNGCLIVNIAISFHQMSWIVCLIGNIAIVSSNKIVNHTTISTVCVFVWLSCFVVLCPKLAAAIEYSNPPPRHYCTPPPHRCYFRVVSSCAPRCIHREFFERSRFGARRGRPVIGFTNAWRAMILLLAPRHCPFWSYK